MLVCPTEQDAQDISKWIILDFFYSQNIINTRNYILNVEKMEKDVILSVLCVLLSMIEPHTWQLYHFTLQNAQDISKCIILEFFHFQKIINTRNYILNVEKMEKDVILSVLCVLLSTYTVSPVLP